MRKKMLPEFSSCFRNFLSKQLKKTGEVFMASGKILFIAPKYSALVFAYSNSGKNNEELWAL
jgi:hypothetical protein